MTPRNDPAYKWQRAEDGGQNDKRKTKNEQMKGMTVIVKKTTQLIAGLVFLYGIYVIIHGHLTPGGGFAGGVILAGSFILLILAYGSDFMNLTREEAGSTLYENLAILIVIFLAASGLLIGARVFFLNWIPKGSLGELVSAGIIPLYNIFVGIEVASSILTIFLALIIFKEEISE
jgi:multisubunit Na+/H+ antiporter MnhB subunit